MSDSLFDDIRPFHDDEVKAVLKETLNDPEFAKTIGSWLTPKLNKKLPWLVQPVIRVVFKAYLLGVSDIEKFQKKLAPFAGLLVRKSIQEYSVHGLEKLDPKKAYLFVSNHRDIVMDPAIVNWALYNNGFDTVRIAIGDNLLTKTFSSNLMRLNKSFIVVRGLKGMKERLRAAQKLSRYIHYSIREDKANVWIAQAEGRAKAGYDKTNSAVIGMFSLSKPKPVAYADYINELNIVPVAISYELDPTDISKARELYAHATEGSYKKRKHEDMNSIAKGMTGWKGRVHLEFGDVLNGDYEKDSDVAQLIDEQIYKLYRPFETNEWAEAQLEGRDITPANSAVEQLATRCEKLNENVKPFLLKQYANGMRMKQNKGPL